VPGVVLKVLLGEMSALVLGGQRVSSKKIEDAGYQFDYPALDQALFNLLGS
jgi:NAD dependent epimerase/dehydratase family enzyme